MSTPTIYRVTTFFRRHPDMAEDEFYKYWHDVHGPLVAPWALKHGILEYTQVSRYSALLAWPRRLFMLTQSQFQTPFELRKHMSAGRPDFNNVLDFDAAADFYIASYKAYTDAYKDPYYINVIEPDENKFVDKGQGSEAKQIHVRAVCAIGVCRSIIKDGKAMVDVSRDVNDVWQQYEAKT